MPSLKAITGLHIEPSSDCIARCPFCSRRQKKRPYGRYRISLQTFRSLTRSMGHQLRWIHFGGNFGDPCTNGELVAIVAHGRRLNSAVVMGADTNGAVQAAAWWFALGSVFGRGAVTFCIDGLADTHARHRVGTDFHTMLRNASAFIAGGGKAVWKFITFRHNQHQVEAACHLAREMGFSRFCAISSRDYNDELKEPDAFEVEIKRALFLKVRGDRKIPACKPFAKRSVYIAADGSVHPCCQAHAMFITEHNRRFGFIVPLIERYQAEINIHTRPLAEILDGAYFKAVNRSMRHCDYCRIKCGGGLQAVRRRMILYEQGFDDPLAD